MATPTWEEGQNTYMTDVATSMSDCHQDKGTCR